MKRLFLFLFIAISISSCTIVQEQVIIPQNTLTGIWKLNGFASSNYKIEMTPDGYLYWFNYNDEYNRIEEFELEYNPNYNQVQLFRPGRNQIMHQFIIYRQSNGRLYFDILINGYDAGGRPITTTDTYYQM